MKINPFLSKWGKANFDKIEDIRQDLAKVVKNQITKEDFSSVLNSVRYIENVITENRSKNLVIGKLFENMRKNDDFFFRLFQNEKSKEIIQKFFLDIPKVQEVLRKRKRIFIESGTTLAYIGTSLLDKEKIKNIWGEGSIKSEKIVSDKITLATNNAIIYMTMLFEEIFDTSLLEGKPVNKYAATYGNIDDPNECDPKKVKEFFEKKNIDVMFTTASYFDVNYGTHVSSAQNCVMKQQCNQFIRNSKNKCSDIFVITSENIHKDVEKALELKSDFKDVKYRECRLTAHISEQKTIADLKKKERDACKKYLKDYLNECDITVVTGSSDASICKSAVKMILEKFEGLRANFIPHDGDPEQVHGCVAYITKD